MLMRIGCLNASKGRWIGDVALQEALRQGMQVMVIGEPVTAQVRDLPRMGIPLPNSDYKTYTYNEI